MAKVYLVYYDNGERYEDHSLHVDKVFSSYESAKKYTVEKNAPIETYIPSLSEEEFLNVQKSGLNYYSYITYEEFLENDHYDWERNSNSGYYLHTEEVHD
jgi:hypothetical protein